MLVGKALLQDVFERVVEFPLKSVAVASAPFAASKWKIT